MLRQHYSLGLALSIYDILLHWRNREELHPMKILSWNLQTVIDYQDILGWDKFCFGLVNKNITSIQQFLLEDSRYK